MLTLELSKSTGVAGYDIFIIIVVLFNSLAALSVFIHYKKPH